MFIKLALTSISYLFPGNRPSGCTFGLRALPKLGTIFMVNIPEVASMVKLWERECERPVARNS